MAKQIVIFCILFLARFNSAQDYEDEENVTAIVDTSCGGWTPFQEEKCYKLFKQPDTYDIGVKLCHDLGTTILMIRSRDEQDAINAHLKEVGIVNNVWIGIKKDNGTFKNFDKSRLEFTNWAKNHPYTNKTGFDCVELSLDDDSYGQWSDQKCIKANYAICEKTPNVTLKSLQNIVIDLKKQFSERLSRLEDNPVPIGFIYIQLMNQSEPELLWPNTEWMNISEEFSNLFFRVEGPMAAPFGTIQQQMTQTIQVKSDACPSNNCDKNLNITIGNRFFDKQIWTGNTNSGSYLSITFKHNDEEIRPRNSAIRVWQRVK